MESKIFEKPETCCTCFESLEDVENSLSCGHWVHIDCIKKQRGLFAKCPLCRVRLQIPLDFQNEFVRNGSLPYTPSFEIHPYINIFLYIERNNSREYT